MGFHHHNFGKILQKIRFSEVKSLFPTMPNTNSTLPSKPQRAPFFTFGIGTVLLLTWFDRIGLSSIAHSGQHVREPHIVNSLEPHIGDANSLQLCSSWQVPSHPLLVVQALLWLSVLGQHTPLVSLSHTRPVSSSSASFLALVLGFKFFQTFFWAWKSGQLSCGMHSSLASHSSMADTARGKRNSSTSSIIISVLDVCIIKGQNFNVLRFLNNASSRLTLESERTEELHRVSQYDTQTY